MDPAKLERGGILFILSAPSGAGKTTISRRVLTDVPDLDLSISCTTRRPRAGEVDGRDYRFLEREAFEAMRDRGEFAEWAQVHDFFYGTPKKPIEDRLAAGRDLLLDIDVQGAKQMKARYREAVAVFVLPPSEQELERRLRARGTDAEDVIQRRLARARAEIEEIRGYDYFLVNRDVEESVRLFRAIAEAERARVARLRGVS